MKIGQIYNIDSFNAFGAGLSKQFADAASTGIVLGQSLVSVDPRIFEKKYPDLTFVNSGIGVDNTGGYARMIESLRVVEQGDFVDASDIASNKGKITIFGENDLISVYEKEAYSTWSDTEVAQAAMGNINLPSKLLGAHNLKYMQAIDKIGYLGQGTNTGLLNNTYFATGVSGDTWANMTPQQLYDIVADTINTQWNGVFNTTAYMASRIVLPIGMYNKMQSSILNTANGAFSVLKALKENFASIQIMATFQATDRMVAYSIDEQSMLMRIPLPLTVGEIIKQGSFKYLVESKFRVAGLDILEKDSGYIVTGLA